MNKELIGVHIRIETRAMETWLKEKASNEEFDTMTDVVIILDNVSYSMTFKELKERLEA